MWVPKVGRGVFPWNFGVFEAFFFLDTSKIFDNWSLTFSEV